MNLLKKLSIGSYVLIVAAILAVVGLIIGMISGSSIEFPMAEMPLIITLTIFSILLIGGTIFAAIKFGDKPWVSVLLLAAAVLLGFCFYNMFMGKNVLMGGIWFSSLDRGYKVAEDALSLGVVSMVFYLIAALAVSVSAFFKLSKNN